MSDVTYFLFSLAVLFGVIVGIVRYRQIDPTFHPLVWIMCLGLIVEVIDFILKKTGYGSSMDAVVNVFALLDASLYTYLFFRWGLFERKNGLFIFFIVLNIVVWIFSTLIIHTIYEQTLYFMLYYSLSLIFFAVTYFNKLVVSVRGNLLKNSRFLVCVAVIIFYTFFALSMAAMVSLLGIKTSMAFNNGLHLIVSIANVFLNVINGLAILWVSTKKNSSTVS